MKLKLQGPCDCESHLVWWAGETRLQSEHFCTSISGKLPKDISEEKIDISKSLQMCSDFLFHSKEVFNSVFNFVFLKRGPPNCKCLGPRKTYICLCGQVASGRAAF